jgi:hypothetical protein
MPKLAVPRALPVQTIDEEAVRARPPVQLLGVSCGVGVDSTAMLVEMARRGIRPDLIQFADTRGELPETYTYLRDVLDPFLSRVGFPPVTVLVRQSPRSGDRSLYDNCHRNMTLPSLAFGYKACSQKWKVYPMEKALNNDPAARACWKAGLKVIKAIGYDAGGRDTQRFCHSQAAEGRRTAAGKADPKYIFWYPLQAWGIDREACVRTIEAAGLPVPVKSACFYCPARKPEEVEALQRDHPELYARAVELEKRAKAGLHGLKSTRGLGRRWAWHERFGDPT